jgi:hypothetical protein
MTLVSLAEISGSVFRPLIGFGQKHTILELVIYVAPQLLEESMGLYKVLAVRPLPLVEVRYGI